MSKSTLTAPILGLIQVRPQRLMKTEISVLTGSNISNLQTSSIMDKSIDLPFSCIDTFTELTDGCESNSPNFIRNDNPEPNRKRRLDHLTYEEKLNRKKLKNRVAAQTSRDRKKAQMDKLEDEIKQLKENNRKLAQANSRLQSEMNRLVSENVDLLAKVSSMASCHSEDMVQSPGVGSSPLNEGPAVPNAHPLLKGSGLLPAPGLDKQRRQLMAMWKILTFCILYPSCWQTSRRTAPAVNSKSLQRVYLKKLATMDQGQLLKLMLRLQAHVPLKWWGRHQKTWCPVED